MVEKHQFSKQAFDCLQELKKAVDQCNGSKLSSKSACIYGNLEAAFYDREIDRTIMDIFKNRTDLYINKFDMNCKCSKR